jgi:hypothetical protein
VGKCAGANAGPIVSGELGISRGLQSNDADPLSVGFSTHLTGMSEACPQCNTGQIRLQRARRNIPTAGLVRIPGGRVHPELRVNLAVQTVVPHIPAIELGPETWPRRASASD